MHLEMKIPTFITGYIAKYFVVIYKGTVGVYEKEGTKLIVTERPKGLKEFLMNLDSPQCSEWGYATF